MTDPIKITSLEAENVKRVRAVQLHPSATGLTIIGGNNNQGKTSLLDTIAWALGGDRFRPSMATREGSTIPPHIKVTLSNGLIVERRGKNSDLKVIDPSGSKAGQQLLNAFIEQLALDLPRFMQATTAKRRTRCSASSVWANSLPHWNAKSRSSTTSALPSAALPTRKPSTRKSSRTGRMHRTNSSPPVTSSVSSRQSLPATARTRASGRWQACSSSR
ncbi:MAG: AAA family ATPase [Butyricicoccus sp.]